MVRVNIDAHLTRHAAHARDGADTAHTEHGLGHLVIDKPRQRFLVHARRRDGVGQDRRPGQIRFGDHRVFQVARQVGADALHRIAHVVQALLRRLFQAEFHRDVDHAILDHRVDVLDALQRGDRVLDLACHLGLELRRCRPRQRGGDDDHRQVDVRHVLDFHGPETHESGQRQQQEEQNGRNRIADRPGGDVHHCFRNLFIIFPSAPPPRARDLRPKESRRRRPPRRYRVQGRR